MNRFSALIPLGLAVVLALAVFAPAAAAQPATLPTWQVGQEVGYGFSLPLGDELAPLLQTIRDNPGAYNISALNYLNLTASLDDWVYQQVTLKTDTAYVLHTLSAAGAKAHFVFNASFENQLNPGTYEGNASLGVCVPPTIPATTTVTMNVSLDLKALTSTDARTNFLISNLTIQNDTSNSTVQVRASAHLFNVPLLGFNNTRCEVTVSYGSRDLALTEDVQQGIATLFSPAWDVFHFPISDNETWWANTTVTSAGTATGTIDVTGLTTQEEQGFFANLSQAFQAIPGLAVSGIDAFPIDLSQVSVTYLGTNLFNDGQIHQTNPTNVSLYLRATQTNLYLSDNQWHEAFDIYPDPASLYGNLTSSLGTCPPAFAAEYSPTYPAPGQGMIVGYAALICPGPTQIPIFEAPNVPPATAKDNIQKTETNYQVFTPAAASNPLSDFFLQAPYWGILIVAAVVIVAVAAVVMVRRRRPSVPPPPPPPAP